MKKKTGQTKTICILSEQYQLNWIKNKKFLNNNFNYEQLQYKFYF
jgi:hypothetical protein